MKSSKNNFLSKCLVVFILFSMTGNIGYAQKNELKIVVTSDVHGRLFTNSGTNDIKTPSSSLEAIYTKVEELRNAGKTNLILLDNGDLMQGTPAAFYAAYLNKTTPGLYSRIMNFMNYDAMTIGNHDIECGPKVYKKLQSELSFPLLGANVIRESDGQPFFQPYTIIERGEYRIAVLGLTTPGVPNWLPRHLWKGMAFQDMVEAATFWVNHLKTREEAHLIVGLFHSGLGRIDGSEGDQLQENACAAIARNVPGLDIIFTGHDHGLRQLWIQNIAGDSVLVLGPGHFAEHLAVASVGFEKTKGKSFKVSRISGEHIEVTDTDTHPAFNEAFQQDKIDVEQWASAPVVRLGYNIYSIQSLVGPAALTDLIHRAQLDYTGADISFTAPLAFNDTIPAKMLTNRDFFRLYEYENYLYTMRLTGQEIKDYLNYSYLGWVREMEQPEEHMLDFHLDAHGQPDILRQPRFRLRKPFFSFDGAAGLRYEVNLRRPEHDRVVIRSIEKPFAFSLDSTYTVAINSYRGSGGGGHLTNGVGLSKEEINKRIIHTSDKELRSIMIDYLKQNGATRYEPRAQWRFTPDEWVEEAAKRDLQWLLKED